MIEKDLQFNIKDDNGNNVDCYIFAYKVISDTEMNVVFKQDNDEDDVVRYGRIIKKDDDYSITNELSYEELDELKALFENEVKNMAERIVES